MTLRFETEWSAPHLAALRQYNVSRKELSVCHTTVVG